MGTADVTAVGGNERDPPWMSTSTRRCTAAPSRPSTRPTWTPLKGLIADDVIWHEAGAPAPLREREAVLSRFGDYSGDVEGDVRVVDILANDDRVVAIMDVKMARGLQKVAYRVVEVAAIEDGMVVERSSISWTPCPTTSASFFTS